MKKTDGLGKKTREPQGVWAAVGVQAGGPGSPLRVAWVVSDRENMSPYV